VQHLLQTPPDRGYPTEYLLTRIRGRRSRLITDWKPLIFEAALQDYLSSTRYQGFVRERTTDSIWRSLIREYRWVYTQMNEDLRRFFRPFFLYSELRTLFICLRHLSDMKSGKTGDLLDQSLLSDEIKQVLVGNDDRVAAVRGVESLFLALSPKFAGLSETLEAEGLRGFEQKMTNDCLAAIMEQRLHPIMKTFFARLIDSRNIMSMYKYLRLEPQGHLPQLLPGGRIAPSRFSEVMAKEDLFGICSLVREFFGIRLDAPEPTKVEIALYRGISDYLKKEGREPFGIGPILHYLWRCSLEVMNLSVLLQGKDFERDLVAAELV
jgi:vacuolar-type H+-ATPase subunit C/Vma6